MEEEKTAPATAEFSATATIGPTLVVGSIGADPVDMPLQGIQVRRATESPTPGRLLQFMLDHGKDLDIDKMMKLAEMQTQHEERQARRTFTAALAAFKANPPTILKTKAVGFDSRDGGSRTEYKHATLHDVTSAVSAALSGRGLEARWQTRQHDGGAVEVICTLSHVDGHSESVSLRAGADTSGKKNNIQGIASTVTYLQRYTLLSILGLSTADMQDDDGIGGGCEEDGGAEYLRDHWIRQARGAKTQVDLDIIWKKGSAVLADAVRDKRLPRAGYEAFKAAWIERRDAIESANEKGANHG